MFGFSFKRHADDRNITPDPIMSEDELRVVYERATARERVKAARDACEHAGVLHQKCQHCGKDAHLLMDRHQAMEWAEKHMAQTVGWLLIRNGKNTGD